MNLHKTYRKKKKFYLKNFKKRFFRKSLMEKIRKSGILEFWAFDRFFMSLYIGRRGSKLFKTAIKFCRKASEDFFFDF